MWSDQSTNFIKGPKELNNLHNLLQGSHTQHMISDFYGSTKSQCHFLPEHVPQFDGLCEVVVESCKCLLIALTGDIKAMPAPPISVVTFVNICSNVHICTLGKQWFA